MRKILIMTRLIGTVDAKVDAKGRAFLPVVFRRGLGGGEELRLIMRKDIFENCLVLYPEAEWYRRLDALRTRLSVWNRGQQDLFRRYVTDVEWVTLDSSGRFLIPKRYMRMAGISQDITFIGMDTTIEIWAKGANAPTPDDTLGESLQQIMDTLQEE